MAVKIRLARRGRKKAAMFDIVIADSRSPRDGRFIEKIGTYNPQTNPATINFDGDKAFDWIMKGAQPTDTVRAMLSYRGVLYRKHLQLGVIKGAISQETADERFTTWKDDKDAKIEGKRTSLGTAKDEARQQRLAAETKVKDARSEAQRAKQAAIDAANAPAPVAEEAPAAEEAAESTESTEAAAPVAESTEAAAPAAESTDEAQA